MSGTAQARDRDGHIRAIQQKDKIIGDLRRELAEIKARLQGAETAQAWPADLNATRFRIACEVPEGPAPRVSDVMSLRLRPKHRELMRVLFGALHLRGTFCATDQGEDTVAIVDRRNHVLSWIVDRIELNGAPAPIDAR